MGPRIKLPPYVHGFIDRHGKGRFYFRRRGYGSVALPGLPWSPSFMSAYEIAMGETPARPEIGESRTKPGTVNAAIISYYNSAAFQPLAAETKRTRRCILERFRAETQWSPSRSTTKDRREVGDTGASNSAVSAGRHARRSPHVVDDSRRLAVLASWLRQSLPRLVQ
jgi:hypothetical protein